MIGQDDIEGLAPHERDDPRRIELRRRELERREAAARRIVPATPRDAVDAWFHLWTIPATVWLRWIGDMHRLARPQARR